MCGTWHTYVMVPRWPTTANTGRRHPRAATAAGHAVASVGSSGSAATDDHDSDSDDHSISSKPRVDIDQERKHDLARESGHGEITSDTPAAGAQRTKWLHHFSKAARRVADNSIWLHDASLAQLCFFDHRSPGQTLRPDSNWFRVVPSSLHRMSLRETCHGTRWLRLRPGSVGGSH